MCVLLHWPHVHTCSIAHSPRFVLSITLSAHVWCIDDWHTVHTFDCFLYRLCMHIINKSMAIIESLQAWVLKNSPGRTYVYRDCSHMRIYSAIACISRTNGRWPTVRKLTAAQLLPTPTYQLFSHCIRSLYIQVFQSIVRGLVSLIKSLIRFSGSGRKKTRLNWLKKKNLG